MVGKNNYMRKVFLVIGFLIAVSAFGQEKDRFQGESELKDCEVKVDLYYSTKRNPDLMKSVEKYQDTELALVTIDKKKGVSYTFYYLIGTKTSLGPTAYLVEPKFMNDDKTQRKFFLFLKYKPKKHIFYDAECFRKNPAIKNLRFETFEFEDDK